MQTRKLVIWDAGWCSHSAEFARLLGAGWDVCAAAGDVEWLQRELPGASALLAVTLPHEALAHAQRLEVLLFPGAGLLENLPERYPAGCAVVNVYEHETPIAEYALMMMLAHVTRLRAHQDAMNQGRWEGSGRIGGTPHEELAGQTVGLFGYGRIGQAIAGRARAFGMHVAAIRKSCDSAAIPPADVEFWGGPDRLAELLRRSNIFVIAAPLTSETEGIIGAAELAMLPAGAFLINVSRAQIVHERALYEALAAGRLAGAALDVWYQYPQPGEIGFGSAYPFHELPSVYCTPHYSAWTSGMIARRIAKMCENLARLARGEELQRVLLTGTWRG